MPRTKAQEKTESCTGATENTEGVAAVIAAEPEPTEPEPTEPEEKKHLIAVLPILFESRQYKPGDVLPAHNLEMLELWIENGAAKWMSAEQTNTMRARPVSATAGLPGRAVPSSREDLAGRIPDTGGMGRR